MKLETYELSLRSSVENDPLRRSPAKGALMHGLLMQASNDGSLHEPASTRAFSQCLFAMPENSYIWRINLLAEKETVGLKRWLESGLRSLYLKHYDLELEVLAACLQKSSSYQELFEEVLAELPPKYASFEILSPLIFKKSAVDKPWPFPEPRLLLSSALRRWNLFSDLALFEEQEILAQAERKSSVYSFRLRSQQVAMDSIKFSGTVGNITFSIEKNEIRQLFSLCGRYGEFAGLGAKTAMGLGAVRFEPGIPRRHFAELAAKQQEF